MDKKRTYLDNLIEDLDSKKLRKEKPEDFIAFIACIVDIYSRAALISPDEEEFEKELSEPYVDKFLNELRDYILRRTIFAIKNL